MLVHGTGIILICLHNTTITVYLYVISTMTWWWLLSYIVKPFFHRGFYERLGMTPSQDEFIGAPLLDS